MRLPFFKSSKSEIGKTTKIIVAPAAPAFSMANRQVRPVAKPTLKPEVSIRTKPSPTQNLARTEKIDAPTPTANRLTANTPAVTIPSAHNQTGTELTVPLAVNSILAQLPSTLFVSGSDQDIAATTINIPCGWVTPQLATGKIAVPLSDLLALFPAGMLAETSNGRYEHQSIALPLGEIVSALPADSMTVAGQETLDVNSPEFAHLPDLVDESLFGNQATTTPAAAAPTPAIVQPQQPVPAKTNDETPEQVRVSLHALIPVLPDNIFNCPRIELAQKADLNSKISLPADQIVPQLGSARISVPLSMIIRQLPQELLVRPLPCIDEVTVPLPLSEVVSQLPAHLFGTRDAVEQDIVWDIPDPFQERPAAGVETEASAPVTEEPVVATPAPEVQPVIETKATQPVEEPVAIEAESIEDESFAIFAERNTSTVPAIEIQEPVALAPTPEIPSAIEEAASTPVQEPPQSTESTSVIDTPIATPEPAPVVEQVVPAQPVAEPVEVFAESLPESITAVQSEPEKVTAVAPEPPAVTATPQAIASEEPTVTVAEPQQTAESDQEPKSNRLINLNNCTIEDLQRFQGVGPALANRIVEFRNTRGGFKSLRDLRHVPGIGRKTFRAIAGPDQYALNRLLGVEEEREMTLQEVVRLVSQLQGIDGAILTMSDGVLLTGQLPEHLDKNSVSVFGPQIFKKVARYMKELRVGQARRMTIFTDQQPLSIFQAGEVFLIVLHNNHHFSKAILRRCERVSQEIANLCRQRAVV